MGLIDSIKNILTIPEDDEFDEEVEETQAKSEASKKSSEPQKKYDTPKIISSKQRATTANTSQMQVVLVKPERYDDVASIADHLNDRKTVVLNLEAADRETSRRIVDFLSGAAYANHGNMRKIARGTFLIVPNGVDMMGELMLEDFEEGKLYL